MGRLGAAVVVVVLGAVVVGVRGVGFEHVFPEDYDGVVLALDDAQYHARRAAYTYENFPAVLGFDPYLNFPHGADVPWPPLYDFGLGAAGRLLGSLDGVLAWAAVLLGLLTALGVYGIGSMLGGRPVGVLAMAFFALLPASTQYSSVGNPDHHAAVSFVATLLLGLLLASLASGDQRLRIWALQAALVATRVAMLLTWHGSILYIVLAESIALTFATIFGRREQLFAQSVGCGASAIFGFAALSLSHSEFAGPWSPVELSRLQPATLAAFALVAAVPVWKHGGGAGRRILVTGLSGGIAGTVLLFLARDGIAAGWDYATRVEPFIARNFETQPLWRDPGAALALYAGAAWLLPLTPLAGWIAARHSGARESGLALSAWTTALAVLAVSSARYGSDFAPAASLSFALLLAFAARALIERLPRARLGLRVAAGLLVPILLLPAILSLWPHAVRSVAVLRGYRVVMKRPGLGLVRSVYAFVDAVREATPETGDAPEYGILTPNTLGFAMKGLGRRPTPAGNFGPYVGRDGVELTQRFYRETDPEAAYQDLIANRIRYVVTSDAGPGAPASMLHRLHRDDAGQVDGRPALGHFRLVTEAPARGVPLGALGGAAPDFVDAPYKLFEAVPGAVLLVRGSPPGRPVSVELEVVTPTGRRFWYRTGARASRLGEARVRVPYAGGPYRVQTESDTSEAHVSEEQIAQGQALSLP